MRGIKVVRTRTLALNINIFFNYVFEYCNISDGNVIRNKCTSSKEKLLFKQIKLLINKLGINALQVKKNFCLNKLNY